MFKCKEDCAFHNCCENIERCVQMDGLYYDKMWQDKKALMEYVAVNSVDQDGEDWKKMPIHTEEDYQKRLLYSENKGKAIKKRIEACHMDEDWKACVRAPQSEGGFWWASNKAIPESMPEGYEILRSRLLAIGGDEVCFAFEEEDLEDILAYGQLFNGHTVRVKRGRNSRCHANCCNLWRACHTANDTRSIKDTHIATGYALSEDGMWRQHSWIVRKKARSVEIIETTVKRVVYYGFVMTYDQAKAFCRDNW